MADIRLNQAAEAYVRRAIESGRYADANELIEDALRLHALDDDLAAQKLAALKGKVEKGVSDADAGRVHAVESFDDFIRLVRGDDA